MADVYAVRLSGGDWRIAQKCKAGEYGGGLGDPERDVWAEVGTTAFIGFVGYGETIVLLPKQASDKEG